MSRLGGESLARHHRELESTLLLENAGVSTPVMKSVSVVVPTYKEAASLPRLLERVAAVREQHGLDLELIISDDNSRDGSEEVVAAAGYPWARMLVRTKDRGLSPAVLDGLRLARHDWLFVMDADLSHPPETIPAMLDELERGADSYWDRATSRADRLTRSGASSAG